VEILDLRHFTSADLRPLLDDETEVWSQQLSWDYSGSAAMILRYIDAKILPGYAAIAVDMRDGIVVIEGPQNEARASAIIAEAHKDIPNKPIMLLDACTLHSPALRRVDPARDQDGGAALAGDFDRGGTILYLCGEEAVSVQRSAFSQKGVVGGFARCGAAGVDDRAGGAGEDDRRDGGQPGAQRRSHQPPVHQPVAGAGQGEGDPGRRR